MNDPWAFALGRPTVRGRLREACADFRVDEELPFAPSGDGDHELLLVEKTDLTTPQAAERLAKTAGVSPRDVGFAGMKDRRAVTRQWFTVPRSEVVWARAPLPGMRVLDVHRHRRKLKRGAHRGNRFRIVVRAVRDASGELEERLNWLRANGMPNFFGVQRFGRGQRNLELARKLFAGRRLPRLQRGMAISAARSWIFNDVLSRRVRDGSWNRLVDGDVAGLDGSGSVFAVDAVDANLRRRVGEFDLHPTGPLWGAGDTLAGGAVAELEQSVVAEHAALADGLAANASMSRRALRARVRDLDWSLAGDAVTLGFALDRGQFATALLRELIAEKED